MTIVELLLVITIVAIIFSMIFLALRPNELLKRSRDQKRLSDLSVLERIVSEYRVDNGYYPDQTNVLRNSNTLPAGNSDLANNAGSGWIDANVSTYNSKLPIDPLNTDVNRYYYRSDGQTFEINAVLEYNTSLMTTDGGNDSSRYEIGNNLTLISP